MSQPPRRSHSSGDARSVAEAAFKAVTTKKAPELPAAAKPPVPGVKQMVSIRLDQDVLEHFQAEGPGWQDRINLALRQLIGKS